MEAIITIEPTLGDTGLIAYECPKCVYVTSELVQHVTLPTNGGPPPSWNRLGAPWDTCEWDEMARADFKTGALKERSRCGAADAITLQGALRFMIIGGHEKDPAR